MFCEVLQDNAQVRYRDRQITATVKGVDGTFGRLTRIDSILVDSREGSFVLSDEVANYANLGVGTAFSLEVRPNYADPLEIYAPKRNEKVNLANPVASLNLEYAFVGGVYATNQQMYDENFVLLPLPMVRSLFDYEKEVSAIELSLVPGADINSVKSRIKSLLGDDFSVKDRYEQQEASFRMMQGEKWMIFLILCFILILALFNVIGSLSMLMIEKKEDVRTLRNMGADDRLIRRIFLFEGWMISGLGALIGIVIGLALCLLQQELGIIKLGQAAGSFIIDAYPVRVEASDILIVFITVLSIGFLAAWYPVHYLGKKWLTR